MTTAVRLEQRARLRPLLLTLHKKQSQKAKGAEGRKEGRSEGRAPYVRLNIGR